MYGMYLRELQNVVSHVRPFSYLCQQPRGAVLAWPRAAAELTGLNQKKLLMSAPATAARH